MNVGSVKTKYYENDRPCRQREDKPKQTQSNPISHFLLGMSYGENYVL